MRLWFYASPGLWSFQDHLEEPSLLRTILQLNPMAPILESYRNVIYGNLDGSPAAPNVVGLGLAFAASCVLLVVGILLFKRMEPAFAKVV